MYNFDHYLQGLRMFLSEGPWFYFEFPSAISFTKIMFATQAQKAQSQADYFPALVEIYAGNIDPGNTNDFITTLDKIYTFPETGFQYGQIYVIENLSVSNVKFVGFYQRKVRNDNLFKHLSFGYMQFLQ